MILGIDAGGTATRWALAAGQAIDGKPNIVAQGQVGGLTALLLNDEPGRSKLRVELMQIRVAIGESLSVATHRPLAQVCAGFTGIDAHSPALAQLLCEVFQLPLNAVRTCSDVELAYRSLFAPGQGYVVYGGTGSIASFIDEQGIHHRAGGRGVYLDDGGGGYWIAREALRAVWRQEDAAPGSYRQSILAGALFEHIGSSDWAATRQFFYSHDRGRIGLLATAVAQCADQDPLALKILSDAGQELARLGLALVNRFGPRPIALLGRAASIHSIVQEQFRESIHSEFSVEILDQNKLARALPPHHAATLPIPLARTPRLGS